MNLTWHIVKKDLRALRWPIALWGLVIAAKLILGVVLLAADGTEGPAWFVRLDAFTKVLAGMECLGFLLVGALIHEDPLVGTSAFWVTRPISGGRLLGAKLLGIGLVFGVLPVLVTLPWWLGCGYGLREIVWATVETVAVQAVVVLVGLLWGVVTDGFGRFLLWTGATLFVVPSVTVIVADHFTRMHPGPTAEVVASRVFLEIALAVLAILGVTVHQFLRRNLRRSILGIGAMAGLIVLVAFCWPWSLGLEARVQSYLAHRGDEKWPASAEPKGLTFALLKSELVRVPGARPDAPVRLQLAYRAEGLPGSQWLLPSSANRYSLRWPDGHTDQGWSWLQNGEAFNAKSLRYLNLPERAAGNGEPARAVQYLPASVAARLQSEPAAFTLPARFALVESESTGKVPLEPGPRILNGPAGDRIAHMEKEGEELLVTFVRHRPAFAVDTFIGWVDYAAGVELASVPEFSNYLLVNRDRSYADWGREQSTLTARVGTVAISQQTMAYRASRAGGGPRPLLEAINALNEAEFTRLVFRVRARFTHKFKVDPLLVEPAR